jgi:hypothetical protein
MNAHWTSERYRAYLRGELPGYGQHWPRLSRRCREGWLRPYQCGPCVKECDAWLEANPDVEPFLYPEFVEAILAGREAWFGDGTWWLETDHLNYYNVGMERRADLQWLCRRHHQEKFEHDKKKAQAPADDDDIFGLGPGPTGPMTSADRAAIRAQIREYYFFSLWRKELRAWLEDRDGTSPS